MDFVQRVKQHSKRIMRMKHVDMVPTASVKKEVLAGAWSNAKPMERLARLCNVVLDNFDKEQVLWAEFDGRKGLRVSKNPAVWVGVMGGKTWRRFSGKSIDPLDLESMSDVAPSVMYDVHSNGLEIIDLTELQVCDWKGGLVKPQVARLVLVGPHWRPSSSGKSQQYFGLVLDFDQRLVDGARASDFLDAVVSGLNVETDG